MTAAAIYARYSSSNQREASIEDQLRICREYCSQHGLCVVREYTDYALTGRTDRRPGFLEMVADGERHRFKALVVYAMDRLSRDRYDLAIYKHRLKKAGVSIVYVTQPLGETPEAALMESLLEGMAAYYSENLSRSVRRGLEGNALKGILTTGRAPYGYTLTPERRLTPDPVTAPVVREIFERYAKGEARSAIIADLNARGMRTAWGRPFKRSGLDTILTNEAYLGVFRWSGIRIENAFTPIVDPSLFDAVRQLIKANRSRRARAKAREEYLLTGKLFCSCCKAPMVGDSGTSRTGVTYAYYTCSKRKRGADCPTRSVRKSDVEAAVLRACSEALTDESIIAISRAAAAYAEKENAESQKLPALKASLAETVSRIRNLLAAIEQGIITPTTKQRLTELEQRRDELTVQISAAEVDRPELTAAHFAAFLAQFRNGDMTSLDFQRRLISTVLNHALVTTQDEATKIALVFNLKTSATLQLSDTPEEVGLTLQYPNCYRVYADKFARVIYVRRG